ncbi:MAG TPA: hypothetical protein VHN36_11535 [Ilumatobacteraceae bacterium]|nr:hypothetical protein [Ilumatobacteraceae bacterium]
MSNRSSAGTPGKRYALPDARVLIKPSSAAWSITSSNAVNCRA